MKIITDIEQGSEEWLALRLGIPTASKFKDIITPAKGDKSKSYTTYMYDLLAERLTGEKTDIFKNEWMERGNELEAMARSSYEFLNEVEVEEVGFIMNDDETIGVSPDGLIGSNGGLEIKSPKSSTMVKYMLSGELPLEYKPQIMGNLWISEREWWDFVAYHPSMKLFTLRVYRDEEYISKMSKHINDFVDEMLEKYEKLKGAY